MGGQGIIFIMNPAVLHRTPVRIRSPMAALRLKPGSAEKV
tara:strand:+ start:658 stop:777 length:120 start_codon:yes stop_codon:yes gene_type:complete